MFAKTVIALATLTASTLAAGDLTIQTPASLIECQPVLLNWSGGQGPYFLAAIPGGQPSAAALKDFGQQTGNTFTWNVDIPAGTSVTLKITDSTGVIGYDQAVTIMPGSTKSCFGGGAALKDAAAADMTPSILGMMMSASASASMSMPASMSSMSAMSAVSSASSPMMSGMSDGMSSMSMSGMSSMSMTVSRTGSASMMTASASASSASASASASASVSRVGAAAASASQSSSGALGGGDYLSGGLMVVAAGAMGMAWL